MEPEMTNLMKSWKRKQRRDGRRSGRPSKPRFRPWLEPLEERIEPAPAVNITLTPLHATTGNADIGSPLPVRVEAQDAYGNPATGYTGTVHFTSNDPLAQLPTDYTFTASDQGVHSFNVTFGTPGSQQLAVTDGVFSDGNTYVVISPAPGTFPFELISGTNSLVVGTPFNVTAVAGPISSPDTGYRGTIHFLSNDPSATLPADYTFTVADQGVHTFQIVPRTASSWNLSIEDTGLGFVAGLGLQVGAASFAKLDLKAPESAIAGVPCALLVTAEDAYGNVVPYYYDSVNFSSSDPGASLPVPYQFLQTDAGIHVFSGLVLNTSGQQTIQVTDPQFGISGSITLDVQPGPAPAPPTINTFNPAGIVIYSMAAGNDGALWGAGGGPALARITVDGQTSIVPIPGPSAGHITAGPDGNLYVADGAGVTVFDPATSTGTYIAGSFPGDAVTGADGNFWGGGATLPAVYSTIARQTLDGQQTQFPTFWSDSNIQYATNDYTPGPDGSIWFTYRSNTYQSYTGYSTGVGIGRITDQGAVTIFPPISFEDFSPNTEPIAVGRDGNVWFFSYDHGITVIDRMTPSGSITEFPLPSSLLAPNTTVGRLLVSAPDGSLWTCTEDWSGTAGFTPSFVRITMTGAVSVFPEATPEVRGFDCATIGPDGNVWFAAVHNPSTVLEQIVLATEGSPASFLVSAVSETTDAGAPFAVTVRVLDANGVQVVGYRGTVHFSSSDQQAGLPADYTFNSSDQGAHTFVGVELKTAGSDRINVSDATAGISGSEMLSVEAGPASLQLQAAQAVDAYHSFHVTVTAVDAFGNRITAYTGTVHFTVVDISAILPVDYTFTTADQGVHTFSVTLGTPGTDLLTVSDTSGQFPGSTIPISVNPGTASFLITGPSSINAGLTYQLTVAVVDGSNQVLTGYRGVVQGLPLQEGQNGLPSYYQFTATDVGVHTFTIHPDFTVGANLIQLTDQNNSALTGSITIQITVPPVPTWIHTYPFSNENAGNLITGSDGATWTVAGGGSGPETVYRIAPDGTFTSFQALGTENLVPMAFAFGPDGNLWITSVTNTNQPPYSNFVTRLTPQGGVTNFSVNQNGVFDDIVAGPDGNMWFIDGPNTIARMSTAGLVTYFTVPAASLRQLAVGADGNIWFSTDFGLGKMTVEGTATFFAYPIDNLQPIAGTDLTAGPDGSMWMLSLTGPGNGHLLRFAPDGNVTQFPVTFSAADMGYDSTFIVAGPDGNLWMAVVYGGIDGGALIKMTTSGVETLYQLDTALGSPPWPYNYSAPAIGADGNLWFIARNLGPTPEIHLVQVVLPTAGPPSRLAVSTPDTAPTAASPFAVTVRMLDANGRQVVGYRGTVHFSSSAQRAGLPADYTFTAMDLGVHTFIGVNVDTAGAESITVQDTTSGIGGSTSFNVQPGPLAELIVRGGVATALIGQPIQVTVTGADAFGNAVQTLTGTVHFTSSDASAGLPPDYAFTASDNGSHTFSVTFNTAGAQLIRVSDSADSLGGGSLSAVVIGSLKITLPTSVQAGQLFSITVSAVDRSNNPVAAYLGAIHFSSTDQQARLPADYRFTAADAGVHTFQGLFLGTSGTDQDMIVDKSNASATASASASVSAGSLASVAVSTSPSAIAGTPFSLTVAVYDRFHNLVTGYTGSVDVSTNDPRGTVPSVYQFQASDHGVHTFTGIVLKTAGLETVTVTDSGAVVNKQTSVQVTPAAASALQVNSATSITAGTTLGVTITLLDPYGNVASGYRGSVHFGQSRRRISLHAHCAHPCPGGYEQQRQHQRLRSLRQQGHGLRRQPALHKHGSPCRTADQLHVWPSGSGEPYLLGHLPCPRQ
jgi:sugar lactone lactonase YvrE